jgi:hypothetical protein
MSSSGFDFAFVQRQCHPVADRGKAWAVRAARLSNVLAGRRGTIRHAAFTPQVWRKCGVPHICHTELARALMSDGA